MLVAGGPTLLRRKTDVERIGMLSLRGLSIALAIAVVLAGVGPFGVKLGLAEAAKRDGLASYDRQLYARAVGPLERAVGYLEDLGLSGRADGIRVALVETYAELGDWQRARALIETIERSRPDDDVRGRLLAARAGIEYALGHFEEAELLYQRARQLLEPGTEAYATLLANEAATWVERGGDLRERARAQLGEARRVYATLGDEVGEAYVRASEGDLEEQPSEARRIYEQALVIAEEHEDHGLAASLLQRIAIGYRVEGDFERARTFYERALAGFELTASPLGQALVYANLATLEQAAGRDVVAAKHVERSEALLRRVDPEDAAVQPRFVADLRTKQGDVYDALGDDEVSEQRYREALDLLARNPDPIAEARTLANYAALLIRVGRTEDARQQLSRAREIVDAFSRGEQTRLLGVLETNLARIDQETGDIESAFARHRGAAEAFAAAGDRLGQAQALENLALLGAQSGAIEQAQTIIDTVLETYRALENRDLEANALYERYVMTQDGTERQQALRELLAFLDRYNVDRAVETKIVLGALPQEVGGRNEIIAFRERVRQVTTFLAERESKADLANAHMQLARTASLLGEPEEAVARALEAEPHADAVPLPARAGFHWELGRLLVENGEAAPGLEHYWDALLMVAGRPDDVREYGYSLLLVSAVYDHWDDLDRRRQLELTRRALGLVVQTDAREQLAGLAESLERELGA